MFLGEKEPRPPLVLRAGVRISRVRFLSGRPRVKNRDNMSLVRLKTKRRIRRCPVCYFATRVSFKEGEAPLCADCHAVRDSFLFSLSPTRLFDAAPMTRTIAFLPFADQVIDAKHNGRVH